MPDHVHILLEVDPQYGINKLVRYLKGALSRILRQEFLSPGVKDDLKKLKKTWC